MTAPATVNRRGLLLGLAAASTAAAGGAASASAPVENPELLRLADQLDAAESEYVAAVDALEWIADEWRHLWPLAPEDLLGGANADKHDHYDTAERDIIGRHVMRDTAVLTKRLSAKFRREDERLCFHVFTVKETAESIARHLLHPPVGRSAMSLARNQRIYDKHIRALEQRLVLAREYEAETARLREAAGVAVAMKRKRIARGHFRTIVSAIIVTGETSMQGVVIKARALEAYGRREGQLALGAAMMTEGWGSKLSAAILRQSAGMSS